MNATRICRALFITTPGVRIIPIHTIHTRTIWIRIPNFVNAHIGKYIILQYTDACDCSRLTMISIHKLSKHIWNHTLAHTYFKTLRNQHNFLSLAQCVCVPCLFLSSLSRSHSLALKFVSLSLHPNYISGITCAVCRMGSIQ